MTPPAHRLHRVARGWDKAGQAKHVHRHSMLTPCPPFLCQQGAAANEGQLPKTGSLLPLGTLPTGTATRPTTYRRWITWGEPKDRGGKWPRNHRGLLTSLPSLHPLSSSSLVVKLLHAGVPAPELGCMLLGGGLLLYLPECLALVSWPEKKNVDVGVPTNCGGFQLLSHAQCCHSYL